MKVIVELTIKTTKHNQSLADKDATEPSPWLRYGMTNFNFFPSHVLGDMCSYK